MNHSTPGFPVHHQLPEITQTHVHRVGDAIQPSSSVIPFSPSAGGGDRGIMGWSWTRSQHCPLPNTSLTHTYTPLVYVCKWYSSVLQGIWDSQEWWWRWWLFIRRLVMNRPVPNEDRKGVWTTAGVVNWWESLGLSGSPFRELCLV